MQAVAAELLPRGITGAMLAELEDGWASLLDEEPDINRVGDRGTRLFEVAARLLRIEFKDETLGMAGRLFAGVEAGRRGLVDVVAGNPGTGGPRIERRARPLTAFAALAARDLRRGGPPFEPEATPGRALTLLVHRLTGR
ncbi:MAG TPA: hypothetical protein VNA29_02450, partial [Sphingomicrobium sp.]|nr:hypothetical protein [Sphingomicrobium sp.]